MTKKTVAPGKITKFDKMTAQMLSGEIQKALAPIAERYGLTLERKKGGTFQADRLPVFWVFTVAQTDEAGNTISSEAADFLKFAGMYGLAPTDLGRSLTCQGKRFTIVGLVPSRPTWPLLVKDEATGKTYKFKAETAIALLAKEGTAA